MKVKHTKFLLMLFLLTLGTILAACSGGDNEAGGNDDEEVNANESGGGRTLIFGRGSDSTSLDPSRTTEGETFKVTKNIFETIVEFEDGGTEIEPGLAHDWEVSDDGLTYTFELEEGVTFHDGTDFNAEAVVKNFERWASGDSEMFPYYNTMFGGFEGDDGHVIESVEADDDYTVTFTLTRPQAPFLKNRSMEMIAISRSEAIEELVDDDYLRNPVGTGPFEFVEWQPNDASTVEKYYYFWKEGLPKLDEVVFRSIPNNASRINAITAGEIDLADGINPSDGDSIEDNADLQLIERSSMNIGYLCLTVTHEPFDQNEFRQAMT